MTHDELFERIKKELIESGLSAELAEAQARQMVSVYDVLIVDPETGEVHIDFGPSDLGREEGDDDENGVFEKVP